MKLKLRQILDIKVWGHNYVLTTCIYRMNRRVNYETAQLLYREQLRGVEYWETT